MSREMFQQIILLWLDKHVSNISYSAVDNVIKLKSNVTKEGYCSGVVLLFELCHVKYRSLLFEVFRSIKNPGRLNYI